MARISRILIAAALLSAAISQGAFGADHRDGSIVIDAGAASLIFIPPFTSDQEILWAGDPLMRPTDAIMEPDGSLLIVDAVVGRIFRFDPATREAPVPVDSDGQLDVGWIARLSPTELLLSGQNGLTHLGPDPASGRPMQTALPTQLTDPFDVTVGPDGTILVADPGVGALISVESDTWEGTTFATEIGFNCWVAFDPDGKRIVASGPSGVYLVDSSGGQAQLIAQGDFLTNPTGVVIDSHGDLFVLNSGDAQRGPNGSLPSVVRVDPETGRQDLMTAGGFLVEPVGILPAPEPHAGWMLVSGLLLLISLARGRALHS